jgi:thiosulfate dehydrogenase [quinone] large subunit
MIWKRNAAYALVRVAMGVVLLFNGIGKLLMGADGFSAMLTESFADTLLPGALVSGFAAVLPFLEVGLGVLLLVGLFTPQTLLAAGALLVVLTFGTVVQAQDANVVAHNVFYTMVVGLLLWLESANAWALDRLRIREEMGAPPERLEPMPPLPRETTRRWVANRQPRSRSRID